MNSRPSEIGLTPLRISRRLKAWSNRVHRHPLVMALPRGKISKRSSEMLISSCRQILARRNACLISWIEVARVFPALRRRRMSVWRFEVRAGPFNHGVTLPGLKPRRGVDVLSSKSLFDHVHAMGIAYVEISPLCSDRCVSLRRPFDYGPRSSAGSGFSPVERLLRRMDCADQRLASSRSARGRGRLDLVYGANGEHARAA